MIKVKWLPFPPPIQAEKWPSGLFLLDLQTVLLKIPDLKKLSAHYFHSNFLLVMICVFFCWSCGNAGNKDEETDVFFSFKNYFENQAIGLTHRKIKIKKTVLKSGTMEERVMDADSVDWEKELKIFMDADMNKKSWVGLYHTDTVTSGPVMTIQYSATDSSLQVKKAYVVFSDNQVNDIMIESRFKNFYYQSSLYLHYRPANGYQVKGEQVIRFASRQLFEINVVFSDSVSSWSGQPFSSHYLCSQEHF